MKNLNKKFSKYFANFVNYKTKINTNFFYMNKKFCSSGIKEEETDILNSKLENFDIKLMECSNFEELNLIFKNNQNIIDNYIEKRILFLDYFSTLIKNQEIDENSNSKKEEMIKELFAGIKIENFKSVDKIFILSLLESLHSLNMYPYEQSEISKLWIGLESLILGTNFLKNISLENYTIILKAFQIFFSIKDSTISAEEIFECVEYQIILTLKPEDPKIEINNLERYAELFILFAKNLEGSEELYSLFIQKIFTKENMKFIQLNNLGLLVELFFSLICITKYVCSKNKFINKNSDLHSESKIENNLTINDNIDGNFFIKKKFNFTPINRSKLRNSFKIDKFDFKVLNKKENKGENRVDTNSTIKNYNNIYTNFDKENQFKKGFYFFKKEKEKAVKIDAKNNQKNRSSIMKRSVKLNEISNIEDDFTNYEFID